MPPAPPPDVLRQGGAGSGDEDSTLTTLSFSEDMKGFVTFGATDHRAGFEAGREAGTSFTFHLTITTPDVHRFLREPEHLGSAVGWVSCDDLGGRLEVERGDFNLFVPDGKAGRTHMYYRLYFTDGTGHPLTLTGYKDVHDDAGFDVWSDTSTLYVRLLQGHVPPDHDAAAELVASGILHIPVPDFARQLTTFRVHGGAGPADRAAALASFGRSFLADLWDVFGARVGKTESPE